MRSKGFAIFVLVATLARLVVAQAAAEPPKPGENLVQDPSFEEYWRWNTWYYANTVRESGKGHPVDVNQSFGTPYFGPSESKWDKERPRQDESVAGEVSGEAYWRFRAGYYQTVDAPPGARVRFSVWVNGFCEDEGLDRCPVILKAGIDPTGGTDWQSGSIRWMETRVADQKYALLTTDATVGPGGSVTVFTWGEPTSAVIYTAAYFDEASLVIIPRSASAPTLVATSEVVPTLAPAPATISESAPAAKNRSGGAPTPAPAPPAAPPSDHEYEEDD